MLVCFAIVYMRHSASVSEHTDRTDRHLAYGILNRIFLTENVCILIEMSIKFILSGSIDNKAALIRVMYWRLLGANTLSVPRMIQLSDA